MATPASIPGMAKVVRGFMDSFDSVLALGAMSGTSMDGVDAAVLRTDGEAILEFGESGFRAYSREERRILRAASGRWPGDPGVDAAAAAVERAHAEILVRFEADLVGFHGQTLAHDPRGRGTHQVGSGDSLARELGLPVVWDFRSVDIRAGGQGAPLAPFFHFACARWMEAEKPIAFVNLGGVGNLTWIDPTRPGPDETGACLAFDTGPANAPIDDLMRSRRGLDFDMDGTLALEGNVDEVAVRMFMQSDYLSARPPKSLDRDAFTGLSGLVAELSDADAAATLAAIAAACVARGMEHCPKMPDRILVTGGGRNNPVLMGEMAERLGRPTEAVESVGLDGDMLEALAFAFLAVRVTRGLPTSCGSTTGVSVPVCGGRVASP